MDVVKDVADIVGYISDAQATIGAKYTSNFKDPVVPYPYLFRLSVEVRVAILSSVTRWVQVIDEDLYRTTPFGVSRVFEDFAVAEDFNDLESGVYQCEFVQSSFYCRGKFIRINQLCSL